MFDALLVIDADSHKMENPLADYGHWDGVLRDCVKHVATTRAYERAHLAKLLSGNCLRFYGPRLARRLERESS